MFADKKTLEVINQMLRDYDHGTLHNLIVDYETGNLATVVRCKDCIYYDPPHIEDGGKRYEYSDMPDDAFDSLGTGLVHSGYGVNVGGRCCVDDMKGYSEDKRVFVSESNYCGRAIRKKVTK